MSIDLTVVRAEALFASDLPADPNLPVDELVAAVQRTVRTRNVRGCVAFMAAEFGDHPDLAAVRMQWARTAAARLRQNRA